MAISRHLGDAVMRINDDIGMIWQKEEEKFEFFKVTINIIFFLRRINVLFMRKTKTAVSKCHASSSDFV